MLAKDQTQCGQSCVGTGGTSRTRHGGECGGLLGHGEDFYSEICGNY